MYFAEKGYKTVAVQHNELSKTQFTDKATIKAFREKEVQVRALEMFQAIEKFKSKKLILAGHSYGCSTTIQAYQTLPKDIRKNVSQLILLDPWFFPLPEAKMKAEIDCPVLVLANEDFVDHEDMFRRN